MDRERFERAVRSYWEVRTEQQQRQEERGETDAGSRGAVTGGAQMDALAEVLEEAFVDAGFSPETIFRAAKVELPGYFRPSKRWDLVVMHDDQLAAAIEFKSHVGSFGNNFNNRSEEVIGSATDFWTAYEKGLLGETRPWLGYFLMLEEHPGSTRPVPTRKLRFEVDGVFEGTSYKERYALLCRRMVAEGIYDAACFVTSSKNPELPIHEPVPELGFDSFLDRIRQRAGELVKREG
jgi:hypothetical protein